MTLADTDFREHAARRFERHARRWARPGDLARALDPATGDSPALRMIDAELAALADHQVPAEALAIFCPPQEGKGLILSCMILTPGGWRQMGDLAPGDVIFGGDGTPCRVTAVHPPRLLDCWQVTFANGTSLTADGDHLWLVQDRNQDVPGLRVRGQRAAQSRRARPWRVVTTRDLAADPARYGVPLPGVLDLPDAVLPLPPYVLGAWLGDGTSRAASITIGDPEVAEHIRAEDIPCRPLAGPFLHSLAPAGCGRSGSPVRRALLALGVWGSKHIPAEYLTAGEKQRLALLQGLMDTDGSVYANESGYTRCEFTTTCQALADDVLTLTRTLGIHSRMHESRATLGGRDISARWRIRFTTGLPVFRLSRKAARLDGSPGLRKPRHRNGITSVVPVPEAPTRCIEVDSPDRTYLAGRGLIPTHNSQRISRRFPEWLLAHDPALRIAIVSYEAEMAVRWGLEIKRDIAHADRKIMDVQIMADSSAAGRWDTPEGGGIYCIGIGGALAGKPAEILIIDDPVKGREEAESATFRERAWDWWENIAVERMAPGGIVCLMMTRWNTDDLAGRILSRPSPLRWRVLAMPAIAVDRDVLGRAPGEEFPSVRGRPPGHFANLQATLSAYTFSSVYQQSPVAVAGNFFRRQAFRYWRLADGLDPVPRLRAGMTAGAWIDCEGRRVDLTDCWRFATADVAASTKTSADWTVVSVWAIDRGGNLILLDRSRGHVETGDHFAMARPLRNRWMFDVLFVERHFFGQTLVTDARAAGIPVAELTADTDKVTRAIPAAARLHAGKVWWPSHGIPGYEWVEREWEPECAAFDKGEHDDQVDTFSYAARVASAHWVPPPPPKRSRPKPQQSADQREIAKAYSAATGNGHDGDGPIDLMTIPLG